jgi:anti-anti-sigma factor
MTKTESNESFGVEIGEDGSIIVHGDIDIAGGKALDAVIVEHERSHHVVLDLSDVFFIDSSGLRCLLSASKRASERDTIVVLRSVGSEISRLLQITGTTARFAVESTRG